MFTTDPAGSALRGVSLQPLDCWDGGFEFRWRQGFSSVVFVVWCVGIAFLDELIIRSEESTGCVSVCLILCDL